MNNLVLKPLSSKNIFVEDDLIGVSLLSITVLWQRKVFVSYIIIYGVNLSLDIDYVRTSNIFIN